MTVKEGQIADAGKDQKETGAADQLGQENTDSTKNAVGSANKPTGTEEGGKEKQQTEEALTVKGIDKLEDGTYEFRVNEDTVYRGKTLEEVFEKIREGTNVKDSLIRKAKISEKLTVRKPGEMDDDEDRQPLKKPDEDAIANAILTQSLNRAGITIEQAKNVENDKYWEKYREDNELSEYAVTQFRLKINRVLERADERIDAQVAEEERIYQNDRTSRRAATLVSDLLEDAKIPVDQVGEGKAFDFQAILDKCDKDGVLDGERVIVEAQKAIRAIERASNKSETRKRLEEDAEKARKDRDKVAGPGGTGRERGRQITPAKDYRSASQKFLQEHPAG